MPRKLKPTTNARRQMSVATFEEITKSHPEKSLTVSLKQNAGRNNQGKITVHHKGSGHGKKYRLIDFKRTDKLNIAATVKAIEYDPYRTSYIALLYYKDGEKRYINAPEGLKIGNQIVTSNKTKAKTGNRMKLEHIPPGFPIYDIELQPGRGAQLVRSAGASARFIGTEGEYAHVQLPSGEIRMVRKECFATIGTPSNSDHSNVSIGKAGRKRWMGIRPTVRGKAKNPVDHPHGGGEGNQPIGLKHPKTPAGKPALGFKTRKKRKPLKWVIKTRKGKTLKLIT